MQTTNTSVIIHSKYFPVLKGVLPFRSLFFYSPKITQPLAQVFSVNGLINFSGLHFWRHFDVICSIWQNFWRHWFNMTKFFPNLVNSSWLWWITHVVLTNQKWGIYWMNNHNNNCTIVATFELIITKSPFTKTMYALV